MFSVSADSGATLTFWVDNPGSSQVSTYTLRPGQEQVIPGRTSAQISYREGRSSQPVPWRKMPAGWFEFQRTGGVWQVYSKRFSIQLDNTANASPFHYRIDGQEGSVPPRQLATIACPTPQTVIEFDRGNQQQTSARLLTPDKNRYVVGLNADSQGLDLFAAEASPVEIVQASTNDPPPSIKPPEESLQARYPVGELQEN
jgi:hypothetical protein